MSKNLSKSSMLHQKLKSCDSHIKKYITQLDSYVSKLESENAKFTVENMRLNLRIKFLESEAKKQLNSYIPISEEAGEQLRKSAEETLRQLRIDKKKS